MTFHLLYISTYIFFLLRNIKYYVTILFKQNNNNNNWILSFTQKTTLNPYYYKQISI